MTLELFNAFSFLEGGRRDSGKIDEGMLREVRRREIEGIPGKATHRVMEKRTSQKIGFICEVVVSFRLKILYN